MEDEKLSRDFKEEALKKTYQMRPDLLEKAMLTPEDYAYLKELEKSVE